MKKTFNIPTIYTAELTSCEAIMALVQSGTLVETKTNILQSVQNFADTTSSDDRFNYWGGKKDGWV